MNFGPFIRVSTEIQSVQGESLKVQKAQLESAIKTLGGKVVEWYGGQEHSTPGWERKELDRLIQDCIAGKVDAVIFADPLRWSRDNVKSETYIETLKEHNIRFFIQTRELDLFNPDDMAVLGIQVRMGQWHAENLARKSLLSKISRAKQGIPSLGKYPYGRTYDRKKHEWSIDPEKKKRIEEIAKAYLTSKFGWNGLGKKFGINGAYLRNVLLKNSGDKWRVEFNSKKFKIHEIIDIPMPPLLPPETIKKLWGKSEANRLWEHGKIYNEYPLGRLIFDGETGRALTGTINHRGQRYYRRHNGPGRYSINADDIESRVIAELFAIIRDSKKFRKAIFEGNSTLKVAEELEGKKAFHEKELKTAKAQREKFIQSIGNYEEANLDSFLSGIQGAIAKNEKRIQDNEAQIKAIEANLATLPTENQIKETHEAIRDFSKKWFQDKAFITAQLKKRVKEGYEEFVVSGDAFNALPYMEKKKFLGLIIGGKDAEGKRFGAYIWPQEIKNHKRPFRYEIRGRLGNIDGLVEQGVGILVDNLDMPGKRHAHYGLGIH